MSIFLVFLFFLQKFNLAIAAGKQLPCTPTQTTAGASCSSVEGSINCDLSRLNDSRSVINYGLVPEKSDRALTHLETTLLDLCRTSYLEFIRNIYSKFSLIRSSWSDLSRFLVVLCTEVFHRQRTLTSKFNNSKIIISAVTSFPMPFARICT